MEVVQNLMTGCVIPSPTDDELGDSEDEGGDEMQWLGYNEVTQLGHGKSLVPYERPKRFKGQLINLQTGRSVRVAGTFHFREPWWQTTILRTKKTRDKHIEPKDYFALCYRLRDDLKTKIDHLADMFISKVGETDIKVLDGKKLEVTSWFESARRDFEAFLSVKGSGSDLDIINLEEHLEAYIETLPEELRQMPVELRSVDVQKYQPLLFKKVILQSTEYHRVQVALRYPNLLHYLPQLFPGNFMKLISLDMQTLSGLSTLIEEEPGFLAFKKILSKECGIMGCETSYDALTKAGLMPKIDQDIRDAILMYEFIKKETKDNGHTYIHYNKILDVLGPVVQLFEEALVFLNKNKVTKTQVENGNRFIFLTQLWQAENKIALGINSLIEEGERMPWELQVDWDSEDFDSIRGDRFQLQAAKLIASKPMVAISGKGGCGKTYVVTKVITAAKTRIRGKNSLEADDEATQADSDDLVATQPNADNNITADEETQSNDVDEVDIGMDIDHDTSVHQQTIELLLTAPTGKAANLLGKRAKCPSFTLHQVIFSFRNLKKGMPWKHENVNTLVVDECSLVSVSTFSFLIELLLEHAQLKRIVLLGDVRQLPSIEPGNFLADTFSSLSRLGCAVELKTNHRAESELIVNNATRISEKLFPVFNPEQFMFRKLPHSDPKKGGDDYTEQDISEEVRRLLQHEALHDHVNSQFISFTRRVCDSINDLCCKHYSNHRTKEFGKFVFRVGDKICCTKNGYVNLYEETHGVMSCYSQDNRNDLDDEGGVNRLVDPDEDTSLLGTQDVNQSRQNGALNTTAGSSDKDKEKKPNQIRLCNGEIFFILQEIEKEDDERSRRTFLLLSDKNPEKQFDFYVDKSQLRKACKIRHAWARTIHTFQGSETDNVVYIVGNRSYRQNWQHVYTAVTRGRKSVFIIGQEVILRDAIRRSEIKRQTSLRKQLVDKLQKSKDFNTTQTSAINITNLNSTTNQTPRKYQRRQITIGQSLGSHDLHQKLQPMKNNLTAGDGCSSLNNTQMVTDILSTLAQEHEDNEHENEDVDYDSEDSQSLISPPQNSKTKSSGFTNNLRISGGMRVNENVIGQTGNNLNVDGLNRENVTLHDSGSKDDVMNNKELKEPVPPDNEEMDDISDPDSDDSQSLFSPKTTLTNTKSRAKTTLKCDTEIMDSSNICMDNTSNTFTHLKSKIKLSKLSLKKGKIPLTMVSSSTVETADISKNLYQSDHSNVKKVRYSFGKTTNTSTIPLPGKNCQTPRAECDRNTNYSMTDVQCHIQTGVSPQTPGYTASFDDEVSSVISPLNPHSTCISTPEPSSYLTKFKKSRFSISEEISEPISNESVQSQWSEVDDSAYLNIDEGVAFDNKTPGVVGERKISYTSQLNSGSLEKSSHVESSRRSTVSNNISTNSQWSEVDDDQYLTLDLDDMKEMTNGNHDNLVSENEKTRIMADAVRPEVSVRSSDEEYSNCKQRDSDELCVPYTPPSPSLLDTPPKVLSKSPSRKRCLNIDSNEISLIKHTLSKLKFK